MKIFYSPKFNRLYKKLPKPIKLAAEKKEKIFRIDPFHPSLKTHKLTGRLIELWAFSIDYSYRIIFEFIDSKTIRFHAIGKHDIYQKLS